MAKQVRDAFIPIVIEHLDYLPPIGRWHDAKVIRADDGEFELEMYGRLLRQLVPKNEDPPDPLQSVLTLPERNVPLDLAPILCLEPRNFDPSYLADIQADAPFPVREERRWSDLPPLIFTLVIPVIWGACKFAGAFLETLGKESAEAIARWLRSSWERSKDPSRDRMVALQFVLEDGIFIYGYIPSEHDDTEAVARVTAGLEESGLLAAFAGLQKERDVLTGMKSAAFIFVDRRWRLAWWTDGDAVYRTSWFQENMPDPARFLGRPLIERADDE